MNTMQLCWEQYEQTVVPFNAGRIQRIECKRAFYCGAYSLMQIMMNIPEDISEEAEMKVWEGLQKEIANMAEWDILQETTKWT